MTFANGTYLVTPAPSSGLVAGISTWARNSVFTNGKKARGVYGLPRNQRETRKATLRKRISHRQWRGPPAGYVLVAGRIPADELRIR